jgi:hypothetical protein
VRVHVLVVHNVDAKQLVRRAARVGVLG